jgi:hypothetical protein
MACVPIEYIMNKNKKMHKELITSYYCLVKSKSIRWPICIIFCASSGISCWLVVVLHIQRSCKVAKIIVNWENTEQAGHRPCNGKPTSSNQTPDERPHGSVDHGQRAVGGRLRQ